MKMLRYPFTPVDPRLGEASLLPFVPIVLQFGDNQVQSAGLLDTGATVNVLPYNLGLELGA